jgi:DNA polymerase III delta subunit
MVIIIHGNGLTAISRKVTEIRGKFDPLSVQEFFGKQTGFDQAAVNFATGGLFAEEKVVILEDFEAKEIDLEKLTDPAVTFVLKFTKALPANSALLKNSSAAKLQVFNFTEAEETNIFPFLDRLAEKNPRVLGEVDKLLDEFGSQYLLTMIYYMLRRMVLSSKKLPSFVAQKIAKQKLNFPGEKLTAIYKAGLETDYKIKNGLIDDKMGISLLINTILEI